MLSDLYLKIRGGLRDFREDGQGMLEYALILVLIAVVVIVILTTVGRRASNTFSTIANGLNRTN